jgi:hypothetical protein
MPSPTEPSVVPIWTAGNNAARTQPTNGQQFTGFTPNFRPPSSWHNWLFGIFSDWIAWFKFILDDVTNLAAKNTGHHVATATNVQNQLDQIDAALSSTGLIWEVPTGVVNGVNTTFGLSQAPVNIQSVIPHVDGIPSYPVEYTVQNISGSWYVVYNVGYYPQTGQVVVVEYMTSTSGVGIGGGISAINNEGAGVGLYDTQVVNVAKFKSMIAGTNMTIVDNGNGTVTFTAAGGGGGGSWETHGSGASPISVVPGTGITPTSSNQQVWWITPSSGSGAVTITATPPIAAGSTIGQHLTLKSVAASNYLVLPSVAGVDINGACSFGTYGQAICLVWDGASWSEDTRRV